MRHEFILYIAFDFADYKSLLNISESKYVTIFLYYYDIIKCVYFCDVKIIILFVINALHIGACCVIEILNVFFLKTCE